LKKNRYANVRLIAKDLKLHLAFYRENEGIAQEDKKVIELIGIAPLKFVMILAVAAGKS